MFNKSLNCLLIITFFCSTLGLFDAHATGPLDLPVPGSMIFLSPAFEPVLMKGIKINPENPFQFYFIIDTGDSSPLAGEARWGDLKPEANKLIKYFLTAMTVPEKDLWVNLSPYEKNRMIAGNLGQTQMGRDLLAQDYILKQLTASLIYPEKELGKKFWDTVYDKAQKMYGTAQIPVNTFNKVWIVADKVDIFERGNVAYIVGAHLKVMLEEDYTALSKTVIPAKAGIQNKNNQHNKDLDSRFRGNDSRVASQIIKEIILPEIEKEVNTGKNFAPLRQMFYSMILASWYKMALKDAILTQIYGNQSKVKGLGSVIASGAKQSLTIDENEAIYQRYLQAYKKGVFNYIKEDVSPAKAGAREGGNTTVPRKYFSGGTDFAMLNSTGFMRRNMPWRDSAIKGRIFDVNVDTSPNLINSDAAMNTSAQISRRKALKYIGASAALMLSGKTAKTEEPLSSSKTSNDPNQKPLSLKEQLHIESAKANKHIVRIIAKTAEHQPKYQPWKDSKENVANVLPILNILRRFEQNWQKAIKEKNVSEGVEQLRKIHADALRDLECVFS